MKVAIYARVSTPRQNHSSQLDAARRWCEEQGHESIAAGSPMRW